MSLSDGSPAAAPVRYTFRKAERLCSRRLLDGLFKHGVAFNTYPLRFVVWRAGAGTSVSGEVSAVGEVAPPAETKRHPAARSRTQEPVQVVLSVSKRHFKRAHDRNRIKRLLREAWRHHKAALTAAVAAQPPPGAERPSAALLVAVLYIGREKPESLAALSRRLRKGLDRLRAELPAGPSASPA